MHRALAIPFAVAACLISSASLSQSKGQQMPAPIVYFDIAGLDGTKQTDFYKKVFGWNAGPGGTISVPVSGPMLSGTLRSDPPAKVIYLGVPDIAEAQKEIIAQGGKVVMPRFEVKGVAVLSLFTDPAGNSMGLVELTADGKTKVP